jgi:hypothetical protein
MNLIGRFKLSGLLVHCCFNLTPPLLSGVASANAWAIFGFLFLISAMRKIGLFHIHSQYHQGNIGLIASAQDMHVT